MDYTLPKLIALDTNWLIWWGAMTESSWGQGKDAAVRVEDNIEPFDDLKLRDTSDPINYVCIREALLEIVAHIARQGVKVAIVARQPSKRTCQKALSLLKIVDFITYIEVDESRVATFRRLEELSGFDYSDMLFYSAEADSNEVRIHLGIICMISLDDEGLNWDLYRRGVDQWRRAKLMESKVPKDITKTRPICIGYSSCSLRKLKLFQKGEYEVYPASMQRWGYGLYCTDDLSITQLYVDWNKRVNKLECFICAVYVWDLSVFINRVKKIWVPGKDRQFPHTENDLMSREEGAQRFEEQDLFVETHWGVPSPYILFARHHSSKGVSTSERYNEMLIRTEIFRALCYIAPVPDNKKHNFGHLRYNFQTKNWNIEVPKETQYDFKFHGEYFE